MLFKVACVIQIAFFDPTKKNQILLFLSGNPVSVLKKKFTINKSEAFIKKWFGFLSETIIENSYYRENISCLKKLQLPIKIKKSCQED